MQLFKTVVLATSLIALTGCSSWDMTAICCDGGYEYRHGKRMETVKEQSDLAARLAAAEKERRRLADELAGAQKQNGALASRISELERQLAERDRELASLRSGAGDSAKLASRLSVAEGDLEQSRSRIADLESQLAAAKSTAGERDRLASDLGAAQAQLAAMRTAAGDKEKLAADLVAAQAQLAALQAAAGEQDKLAADLAAAKQRLAELEKQLGARDKDLAELRGDLSAEMAKLQEAERGLVRALRPQVNKGNISIHLNNERLLINLASSYLFGTGEDQLKPGGVDALKRVGAILKDYPEYKVTVDGHTDNRPIRSALKKKFPTNKELSEARAANAAKALAAGGLTAVTTAGYADTKPVAPNITDAGRAKNRRVEVRVTK